MPEYVPSTSTFSTENVRYVDSDLDFRFDASIPGINVGCSCHRCREMRLAWLLDRQERNRRAGISGSRDRVREAARRVQEATPKLTGRTLGKGLTLFGVELELERANSTDDSMSGMESDTRIHEWGYDKQERVWIEPAYDGSLSSGGVELRSAPLPLRDHMDGRWEPLFAIAPNKLYGQQRDSHPVGMHVHVSRGTLHTATVGKLIKFVNTTSNQLFVNALAGRGANQYCHRGIAGRSDAVLLAKALLHERGCPAGRWDAETRPRFHSDSYRRPECTCLLLNARMRTSRDRYRALNVDTGGKPTVEFRLFASTVDRDRFYANLQATAALVHWAAGASWANLGWRDYVRWLQGTPNRAYRSHRAQLEATGYDDPNAKRKKPSRSAIPVRYGKVRKICV